MRKLQYLSPSSISMFYKDIREFYLQYLCEAHPPRGPQTRPMSVGSAFDAYVKSYLHEKLFGKNHKLSGQFETRTIFEAQVEKHNRDWAWSAGAYVFECYKRSGALTDLMLELSGAISEPRFEFEIKGVIDGYKEGVTRDIKGIVLLGKPDVFYINRHGGHVILDFKVNGFCGNYNTNPMQGYLRLRDILGSNMGSHKKTVPMIHKGTMINIAEYLEYLDTDWASQLSIYAWLCGCEVGEDFICAIEQIVCDGSKTLFWTNDGQIKGVKDSLTMMGNNVPQVRVAEHRLRVQSDYQYRIFAKAQYVWEVIHSDYVFRDVSKEESQEKCRLLDAVAATMNKAENESDLWFITNCRY